jgi:hypothetical protein
MADLTNFSPLVGSFEQVTVNATVGGVGLTPTKYRKNPASGDRNRTRNARVALVSVEDAEIRYTVDGTAPTSTVGHVQGAGSNFIIEGYDAISQFRAIRTDVSNATLSVTYFGV